MAQFSYTFIQKMKRKKIDIFFLIKIKNVHTKQTLNSSIGNAHCTDAQCTLLQLESIQSNIQFNHITRFLVAFFSVGLQKKKYKKMEIDISRVFFSFHFQLFNYAIRDFIKIT